MNFGDSKFRIVVEGFERVSPVGDSPLVLGLEGPGWSVGSEIVEFLGGAVSNLVGFGRNGAARHWGAFVGVRTASEVIERVNSYVYGEGGDRSEPWYWDKSSALGIYALSSLFEENLGAGRVVVVRGIRHETIIVQSKDGAVEAHDVPLESFDRAIDGLAEWLQTVEAGGSLDD